MKIQTKGGSIQQWAKNLGKEAEKKLEQKYAEVMKRAVLKAQDYLESATPVWTGRTLANFQWSTGQPKTGAKPPPFSGAARGARGEGNRRPAAAQDSRRSLEGLSFKKFPDVYLSNNTIYPDGHTYADLEFGLLPTPGTSRVPAQGLLRHAASIIEREIKAAAKEKF